MISPLAIIEDGEHIEDITLLEEECNGWQVWHWLHEAQEVDYQWIKFNDGMLGALTVGGWKFWIAERVDKVWCPESGAVGEASRPRYFTTFLVRGINLSRERGWLDALKSKVFP